MTVLTSNHHRAGPGFDPAMFLDLAGGDHEFLAELIALFERDSTRLVAEVRLAADGPAGPALERSAHALRGLLSHLGEPTAIERCRRLETFGAGRGSINIGLEVDALATEVAAIREVLARLAL